MGMRHEARISIAGLGMILYSPFAVRHIAAGEDYLQRAFWQPEDVAAHVNGCQLTGFCTGSSGDFNLVIYDTRLDKVASDAAEFRVKLGLEVRDGEVIIRDLYHLMDWDEECAGEGCVRVPCRDGYYRILAYTSAPESGILGDEQTIYLHFQRVRSRPVLNCQGVPYLCEE
jgi:hypothetical protein